MTETRICRAREIFEDPDGPGLIAEYAVECAIALVGKPEPRLDIYENLETAGLGQCFAAYENGRLRGFAMVLIAVAPHYSLRLASIESIFASRDAHCGQDLMWAAERYSALAGCVAIFYSAPVGSRLARLLFLSEDLYTHTNSVFCRRLT